MARHILIIVEAAGEPEHPQVIHKLDFGIILVAVTAMLNFIAGSICVRAGKRAIPCTDRQW